MAIGKNLTGSGCAGGLAGRITGKPTTYAAAGSSKTDAQLVTDDINLITTVSAGQGVKLRSDLTAGDSQTVANLGSGAALLVYPPSGGTMNGLAADLPVTVTVGGVQCFQSKDGINFLTELAPPLPSAKYTKNTTSGVTTAAAGDLTGASFVCAEYSAVGAAALTTRTATQMFADMPYVQVGDSYMLLITNTSGGTTTLTAGTGVTLTGTMTMATNTTRLYNVKFVSGTAVTIQSVGVGTIS